ncbi:MAG: ComEC/Rec2 family competence protein [Sphingomonadales bacterium]|nr:ComEC/Rec2 family competence protein [Sphingomonadales bacterium]
MATLAERLGFGRARAARAAGNAALQHGSWRSLAGLSSVPGAAEKFLEKAGLARAPWLAVGFATGIAAWFGLANRWQWLALLALAVGSAGAALALMARDGRYPLLRIAIAAMALAVAAGCATVWGKSALTGTPPIAQATAGDLLARVLAREDEPGQGRIGLLLATRVPRSGRPIRLRLWLPVAFDRPGLAEGAVIRVRARMMPPSPPLLPGGHDFARAAWFSGLAATGSALAAPTVITPAPQGSWLARARHAMAARVRARLPGSAGGIAALFVSGERGGIAPADAQAMRDAGLAHLLVIGGLHLGAVVALAYMLVIRLLPLVPALALRVRLPLVAASLGALVGIGYMLLTGGELSTVRACIGALLVLAALALGRQPFGPRMLGVAAIGVMLAWPEAVVGPSFQMSFGSVLAIVALHEARPVRDFLAWREESWLRRIGRKLVMLVLVGLVIDLALLPVALFHFHRAGLYGALANLLAIPLTAFFAIPLEAAALLFDGIGCGAPVWWLAGKAFAALIAIAHMTVDLPGAVAIRPAPAPGLYLAYVAGMLWLGLWRGSIRLLGLPPAVLATLSFATARPPDLLIPGDGRNLALVADDARRLLVLHEPKSAFARAALLDAAGGPERLDLLESWPGTSCNRAACVVEVSRGGRLWRVLVLRGTPHIADAQLARACAGADIVIASDKLFGPCQPALIRADRSLLMRSGGLALDLVDRRVSAVVDSEGDHPWWRAPHRAQTEYADDAPGDDSDAAPRAGAQ